MNKWIKNAWIAVMVLFAALISTGCGSKEEAYREIRVLSLEGTASVTRASVGTMDAYKDMRLESGDEVAVDSSSNLVLELDGDKYVMLEPGTKLTLEAEGTKADSKTTIHLQAGAVVNHLTEKLNDNSSYEVTVPNSTMAVRGTVFRVEVTYDENGDSFATVSVFQGVVASRLIFPDGTIEELDKEKQIPMGKEVIVHGDTDISEYLWGDTEEPHDIDYRQLPKETLEFLIDCINRMGEDEEFSIDKDECEELIREMEQEETPENVDEAAEEPEETEDPTDETIKPLEPVKEEIAETLVPEPLQPTKTEPESPKKSSSSSETSSTETKKTYTVTFRAGNSVFCTQSVEEGQTATRPTLLPSQKGYWAVSESEAAYDFKQKITGDLTLIWRATEGN